MLISLEAVNLIQFCVALTYQVIRERNLMYVQAFSKSAYQKKIFFLFLIQNICCGYSKELSH